ncbi:MAG: hypothetical protein JRJ76_16065, partial [Deltaproteobacteria bacterium]|nr:hypothetical protein [Deltaproteobacteria bacterium]
MNLTFYESINIYLNSKVISLKRRKRQLNDSVSKTQTALDDLCVNTIRTLAMDAIQKANSGHPGAPMGLAPAAYVLWTRLLKHNPDNPA